MFDSYEYVFSDSKKKNTIKWKCINLEYFRAWKDFFPKSHVAKQSITDGDFWVAILVANQILTGVKGHPWSPLWASCYQNRHGHGRNPFLSEKGAFK